ncbi:MAG: S9 family peptidase, partial [Planctomycetota bacterium]
PCREPIAERLKQLFTQSHPNYYGFNYVAGKFFAIKNQPPNDQPMLVVMDSPMNPGSERVIVDPNRIDTSGRTAMDFYVVSPDARFVAVSLSHGGTEDGDVHVYRVADGTALADVVPRVNGPTAGGDVAWLPDASGFYYTHYPREGERPAEDMRFFQQIYFHKLGTTTDADTYVLGKKFPRIAEIDFVSSPDGRAILAVVANGDGGEFAHYLRWRTGKWVQLTRFEDKITSAAFGPDHSLYLLSTADAPRRKILQLRPGKTRLSRARTIVPPSDRVITGFVPTTHYLYVADILGGPSLLRRVNLSDGQQQDLPLPEVASVGAMTPLGGDKLLYRVSTYVEPSAAYVYDPATGKAERTPLAGESIADFSNVEVKREFARSKDGTMVPMTVLRPKGIKLDGDNPTVLYG